MNSKEIIPYLSSGWRLPVILTLVIGGGLLIWWAYSGDSPTEKERKLDANISIGEGKNTVITNLVVNGQGEVNNAANLTNEAVNNYHTTANRDSNQYHGSGSDAFCAKYPTDSTCVR